MTAACRPSRRVVRDKLKNYLVDDLTLFNKLDLSSFSAATDFPAAASCAVNRYRSPRRRSRDCLFPMSADLESPAHERIDDPRQGLKQSGGI